MYDKHKHSTDRNITIIVGIGFILVEIIIRYTKALNFFSDEKSILWYSIESKEFCTSTIDNQDPNQQPNNTSKVKKPALTVSH